MTTLAAMELLYHVRGLPRIKCADLLYVPFPDTAGGTRAIQLKVGYTDADFNTFLDALDFSYDSGYGTQELYGNIWFEDDTWSERGEYDGSEWWEYHCMPKIPADLT